jgi:hypothetical protein
MNFKTCCRCQLSLEINTTNFGKDSTRKDKLCIYCRPCRRIVSNANYTVSKSKESKLKRKQEARQFVFDWYKTQGGCQLCGETNPCCLQADHIDRFTKKYSISIMVGKNLSPKLIAEELEKCRCLCANCHAKQTALQFNWYKDMLCLK